ncbi:MAG TPA: XDD4 family exosortase-dependent surface protein [Tepidisphaeraceae bacterium]|nr:XDD4 family exosortase-dependent surface protein [Tepidisphaeraceae bacterium]
MKVHSRNISFGLKCLGLVFGVIAAGGSVRGDTIFTTPSSASTSGPVSAKADFTLGNGTITLTLTNLISDPGDVAQNLSAFSFTLNGTVGANSLVSGTGTERTINSNKTYTEGSSVAAGWVESSTGNTLTLDVLSGTGHAGPAHTIIGSPATADNKYDNANGSIKNNGPHNPFLDGSATFTLDVAGVTTSSSIQSVTFQFGTTDGSNQITVNLPNSPLISAAPLPASAWGGLTLIGLMGLRRRSIRRAAI